MQRIGIAEQFTRHDERDVLLIPEQFQLGQMLDLTVIIDPRNSFDHFPRPGSNPLARCAALSQFFKDHTAVYQDVTFGFLNFGQSLPFELALRLPIHTVKVADFQSIAAQRFQAGAFLCPFNRIEPCARLYCGGDLLRIGFVARWHMLFDQPCHLSMSLRNWIRKWFSRQATVGALDGRQRFSFAAPISYVTWDKLPFCLRLAITRIPQLTRSSEQLRVAAAHRRARLVR